MGKKLQLIESEGSRVQSTINQGVNYKSGGMKKIFIAFLLTVLFGATGSLFALTSQTISFTTIPGKYANSADFTITASAQSGLPVTFTVTNGASIVSSITVDSTVSGTTYATVALTGTAVGTVTIMAEQAGNGTFAAATPVSKSFSVSKSINTITFPTISTKVFTAGAAGPVFTPTYTATFNFNTIAFTSSNNSVATVNASTGEITCVGSGSVTIKATIAATATEAAATASRTFAVNKVLNSMTFPTISNKLITDPTFTVTATTAITNTTTNTPASAIVYTSSNTSIANVNSSTGVVTLTGTTAGAVTITASCAATAKVAAVSVSRSFNVSKESNVFTFPTVANQYLVSGVAGPTVTPTYTASVNFGSATYASSNTSVATVDASTGEIVCVGGGIVTITGTVPATATESGASASRTFTVYKVANTMTFEPIPNTLITDTPPTLTVTTSTTPTTTATPAEAIVYSSSNPNIAAIDANSGVITFGSLGGSVTITATCPANAKVAACSASRTFTVSKETNVFTFPTVAAQTFTVGVSGPVFTPSYTATLNFNTATYASSNTSVATVDASTGEITCVGGGQVTITGTIAATATESGATASRTFTVNKITNAMTFPVIANKLVTDAPFSTSVTTTVSNTTTATPAAAIIYSSSNTSIATVDASGLVTLTGTASGVVTITASCAATAKVAAVTVARSFNVMKEANTFTFPVIASQTFTVGVAGPVITPSYTATLNFNTAVYKSSNPLVATVDASTGVITCTGGGAVTITATIPATATESGATASRSFNVSKLTNTMTFAAIPNVLRTDAPPTLTVTTTITNTTTNTPAAAIKYTSSNPTVAAVDANTGVITLGTGVGTVKITASCAATAKVNACSAYKVFTVSKAPQVITHNTTFDPVYYPSDSLIVPDANATSSEGLTPIVYSIVSGPATINSSTGDINLTGALGTVIVRASQAGDADYAAATKDATFAVGLVKGMATGIEELASSGLSVYPNPSNGLINIAKSNLASVTVFDMLGNVVAQKNNLNGSSNASFDLSGTPAGVYMVQIALKDGSASTERIVVQ